MNKNTLGEFLINSALRYPEKTALNFGDNIYTFKNLYESAASLAGYFYEHGLKKGDRVIIYLENGSETVISVFGALLAGAVFSVIGRSVKAPKLQSIISNCSPAFIVTDVSRIKIINQIRLFTQVPPVVTVGGSSRNSASFEHIVNLGLPAPDISIIDLDLAAIIYTSGSMGEPKGVTLTHRNIVMTTRAITQYLGSATSDITLSVLPLSFIYGLYQVFISTLISSTMILGKQFGYPYQLIKLIESKQVTGFPCVPTMIAILLQMSDIDSRQLSSVRFITSTGAPLPPAYIPRIKAIFPNATIFSMYGLTECQRVSYLPPQYINQKPDSVGIPLPSTEVFVEDEFGIIHDRNAIGELIIRGFNVMQGYWNDPKGTAGVLKPGRYPWEKVFYSGDIFKIDEDGFLYFLGRRDDIIKVRGEKVSPKEIENILYQVEDVMEARALPVPDKVWGTAVKAEIVLRQDSAYTVDKIKQHCKIHLEDHKIPKYINFVKELPKSESGKILKRVQNF